MKEFVENIVKRLVDQEDKVEVKEVQGERMSIYELRVGDGDLGKVIGKRGETAKAIRTLLNAAGAKLGKRCNLEIIE